MLTTVRSVIRNIDEDAKKNGPNITESVVRRRILDYKYDEINKYRFLRYRSTNDTPTERMP